MDKQKTVVVPEIYHCDFVMCKEGSDMYSLGIRDGDMLYIQAQKSSWLFAPVFCCWSGTVLTL